MILKCSLNALNPLRSPPVRGRGSKLVARERIEVEDWQGTCGCDQAWKAAGRIGLCPCAKEHQDIMDQIDAALAEYANAG